MRDMMEIASLLDDTIQKGLSIKRKGFKKALTFNPLQPHEMGDFSSYHNPYRMLPDGSYAPYESKELMAPQVEYQVGDKTLKMYPDEEIRRDGYREVDQFYAQAAGAQCQREVARFLRQAGATKAMMYAEIDCLFKSVKNRDDLAKHYLKRLRAQDKRR
jgi:hypothetical protein